MVSMAEPKSLATRGVLAIVAALALSAVVFVYTGNLPIQTEMEARSAYLAEGAHPPKASEATVTVTTTQALGEGLPVTTVTMYTTVAGELDVQTDYARAVTTSVTTVTKTVTMNVTVTVTKSP